jgi:hypothetical protein
MTAARDTERQARYEKEWNEVEAMFYGGAEDDPIASKVESVVLEWRTGAERSSIASSSGAQSLILLVKSPD